MIPELMLLVIPLVQADALTGGKGFHLDGEKKDTHIQKEVLENDWNEEKV